jgi:hypothetical protein
MSVEDRLIDAEQVRIKALLTAPGCKVEPYLGDGVSFQPIALNDIDGFEAEMSAVTNWGLLGVTTDRAGVVALGVVDLVLRWPLFNVWLTVEIDGQEVQHSRTISGWQSYEWLETSLGGYRPPRAVATISEDAQRRIEQLWHATIHAPLPILEHLLGPLALASSSASATNPFDRVMWLWSGLELLYPSERKRIEAIVARDPSFADVEEPRGAKTCAQLLRYRDTMSHDSWLRPGLRAALQRRPSTAAERVEVATLVAYAIRCKIAHGQWARIRDDRRTEAGAAERWLWQILEREIELRLMGTRLAPIRAIERARFGNLSRSTQDLAKMSAH